MSHSNDKKLGEAEEILIMRFIDGECSWFDGWRARRLVARDTGAARIAAEFRQQGVQIRSVQDLRRYQGRSLWHRVEQALAREERIGELSRPAHQRYSLISNPVVARFGWVMTGALTAATVALSIAPQSRFAGAGAKLDETGSPVVQISTEGSGPFLPVQLSGVGASVSAVGFGGQKVRRPVELEWVRSGGRLQFINSDEPRSTILWVNRSRGAQGRSKVTIAAPTVTFSSLTESR